MITYLVQPAFLFIAAGDFSRTATKKPPVSCRWGYILKQRSRPSLTSFPLGQRVAGYFLFSGRSRTSSGEAIGWTLFGSRVVTVQEVSPGRRTRVGRQVETSLMLIDGNCDNAAETTASFSSGFNEQVEYTIRPPGFNNEITRDKILSCNLDMVKKWKKMDEQLL
jgi:hypothetical protein